MPDYMDLFDPKFNWKSLVGEQGPHVAAVIKDVRATLQAYFRRGIQQENGLLMQPHEYNQWQMERELAVLRAGAQMSRESAGFITPDMTPNMFATATKYKPTTNYEPDTTYLDFMPQRRMELELEDRREWEAYIVFSLMKEAGKIKYGYFSDTYASMRNAEWGAGMNIYTTWFETNQFGVKMSALAPKFRYAYYDQMADAAYTGMIAGITTDITGGGTNRLVPDINTAVFELMRYENWAHKFPWGNAPIRIVAAPEWQRYLDAAMAASYALGYTEQLNKRISVTYSSKLTFTAASAALYILIDKWEQNEVGTRVPLHIYGQATDIDVFAEKISYRGAYGMNWDTTSGRVLTFDTTAASFLISSPMPVTLVSP